MKKNSIYVFIIAIGLILSACGSNSKPDGTGGNIPNPPASGKITVQTQSIVIDKSNGDISANVRVTSTYASSVVATLNSMDISLGGCSLVVGSVSANPDTVTLDSTAPSKDILLSGKMTDPLCVPTSYQLTGSNTVLDNGQTETSTFATNTVTISLSEISFEDSSILKLEVLTKQVDLNESGITKDINLRVTQGTIGAGSKKIKLTSTVNTGSFSRTIEETDSSGDATFVYTSPDPMVDDNLTVTFCLEENSSICDTAKINLTTSAIVAPAEPIDNINYLITFVPNGGVNNLALGTRNNAIVTLIDKDTKEAIPSSRIKSITVTSRDLSVLKLTPEGGGTPAANITFGEKRNSVPVLLTADKINSGLAVIEVVIEYTNLNGVDKTRGQLFSVAVLSGAPTAFSVNDDGVGYNANTKQFEHKFIVQATDASGNKIATTGFITVSAMASFAKDASGREILYGRHSGGVSATLSPNSGKARLELTGLAPFNTTNIKENRAFVAVFGDVDTYEALGKWNIENIISGDMLDLSNEYYGEAHSNLGMAIGYNYRDKICTSTFEESVVVVDSADGTYKLDETGKAIVELKYDSYMVGKRAMILVNMTGLDPNTGKVLRSGEVHEQTLYFHLPLKGKTVKVPAGATDFPVGISGVIDTGTEDEWSVVNSTFSCELDLSNVKIVSGPVKNDPASCDYNGQAFLTYVVSSTGEEGSVTFKKCQVDLEPLF